jgi:hypothetical protein
LKAKRSGTQASIKARPYPDYPPFPMANRLTGEHIEFGGKVLIPRRACFLVIFITVSVCIPHFADAGTQIRLRINTSHGLENAKGAVADAGLKPETEVSVTPSSPYNGRPFLPPDQFIGDARTIGATILSSSFSGWRSIYDSALYLKLTGNGMVHVYAYVPQQTQPPNTPPPASFVTVNRIGGATGDGIEFGVPATYMHGKGQSTTSSGVTAQLAGLMACLKYLHPAWNWFDIKAALRATASNYATGYDPQKYGYGSIDYPSANALADAATLPLFAPAAVVFPQKGNHLFFCVNSFKQSRRATDVLFKFQTPPVPHLKELTLTEIIAMGGRQVFSGDLSTTGNVYPYRVTRDETAYFVWFTEDAQGMFSRIERYSIIGPVKLTLNLRLLYGPRLIPGT